MVFIIKFFCFLGEYNLVHVAFLYSPPPKVFKSEILNLVIKQAQSIRIFDYYTWQTEPDEDIPQECYPLKIDDTFFYYRSDRREYIGFTGRRLWGVSYECDLTYINPMNLRPYCRKIHCSKLPSFS